MQITQDRVEIAEQVQFDFGTADLTPKGRAVVGAVASALRRHPELLKVEIQGHTDDIGPRAVNQTLSDDRAEAVKAEIGTEYRPVQAFFTTGRTALPTSFFLSNYDMGILREVGRRIGEVATVGSSEDRIVSVFPYAPHLAFWQVQEVGIGSGTFILQTGGGKVMGTAGILRVLAKVQPSVVAAWLTSTSMAPSFSSCATTSPWPS